MSETFCQASTAIHWLTGVCGRSRGIGFRVKQGRVPRGVPPTHIGIYIHAHIAHWQHAGHQRWMLSVKC